MENRLYLLDTDELDDKDLFAFWYNRMPAYRRKKTDAYRLERDKKLSLAAGILILSGAAENGADSCDIYFGDNGKPYFSGRDDLFFNVSHSGKYCVCAFSDREVGVDIELIRSFEDSLARFVFSEDEIKLARSEMFSSADEGMTRLWTVKESAMKYLGTGLSLEPKKISTDGFSVSAEGVKGTDRMKLTYYSFGEYLCTVCSEYLPFTEEKELSSLLYSPRRRGDYHK